MPVKNRRPAVAHSSTRASPSSRKPKRPNWPMPMQSRRGRRIWGESSLMYRHLSQRLHASAFVTNGYGGQLETRFFVFYGGLK